MEELKQKYNKLLVRSMAKIWNVIEDKNLFGGF